MLRLDPPASARHPGQLWVHLPQPELPPPLSPRPPAPAAGPSGLEWQPTPALYAMSSSATVPSIGHLRVVISKLICGGRRVLGGLMRPQRHRPYLALTWNSAGLCTGTSAPRQPRLRCPATLHTVRCPAGPRRVTRSSPLPARMGHRGPGVTAVPTRATEPPQPRHPLPGRPHPRERAMGAAQLELEQSVHGPGVRRTEDCTDSHLWDPGPAPPPRPAGLTEVLGDVHVVPEAQAGLGGRGQGGTLQQGTGAPGPQHAGVEVQVVTWAGRTERRVSPSPAPICPTPLVPLFPKMPRDAWRATQTSPAPPCPSQAKAGQGGCGASQGRLD